MLRIELVHLLDTYGYHFHMTEEASSDNIMRINQEVMARVTEQIWKAVKK